MSATAPIKHYFNPRSREGATVVECDSTYKALFQSTLPRRSDPSGRKMSLARFLISIHAPAKERLLRGIPHSSHKNFNPRSREGATVFRKMIFQKQLFQSTLPRRSDVYGGIKTGNVQHFNPRSREGATANVAKLSSAHSS